MPRFLYLLPIIAGVAHAAAQPPPTSPISAERIKEDVRVLSSDEFLGRGPGEPGEEKTVAYLAQQLENAGLEPAAEDGRWYQDVPLVRLDRQAGATLALQVAGETLPLVLGRDATLGLRNADLLVHAGSFFLYVSMPIIGQMAASWFVAGVIQPTVLGAIVAAIYPAHVRLT